MKPKDVEQQLKQIKSEKDSNIRQEKIDSLWTDVLEAIAGGNEKPDELAREALKVIDLEF